MVAELVGGAAVVLLADSGGGSRFPADSRRGGAARFVGRRRGRRSRGGGGGARWWRRLSPVRVHRRLRTVSEGVGVEAGFESVLRSEHHRGHGRTQVRLPHEREMGEKCEIQRGGGE